MYRERVCARCNISNSPNILRCGHFVHRDCFEKLEYRKKCPTCKKYLSSSLEAEELFAKIKSSNLHVSDAAELCICLDNFIDEFNREYYKSRSYDKNILENLQGFGFDINKKYENFNYLVFEACMNDDVDKINLLIEHGMDLDIFGKQGGFKYACYNSNVFERFIQAGIKLNYDCLERIVLSKNVEMLNRAIRLGADLNAMEDFRETRAIHIAAQVKSIQMLQILIDNGADFNAVDRDGDSVLHYACDFASDPQLVEYLIESGIDISIQNSKKRTSLMTAVKYSNASVTEYLIRKKADINVRDIDGNTPLHFAVSNLRYDIAKILLREGADVNAKNKDGNTPLHVVADLEYIKRHREPIVKLLLENGADINALDKTGKSPFYYLHEKIDSDLKMKFINSGADLTLKNQSSRSILDLILDL